MIYHRANCAFSSFFCCFFFLLFIVSLSLSHTHTLSLLLCPFSVSFEQKRREIFFFGLLNIWSNGWVGCFVVRGGRYLGSFLERCV